MSGKQTVVRGKIDRLKAVVQEAGMHLKTPEEKAETSNEVQPKPQTKPAEKKSNPEEDINFLEAMDGVERLSWNRRESAPLHPVPPPGEDPDIRQARWMCEAMDETVPIPLTEHPEYIEGWVGVSGRRYLPDLRNGLYSIQGQIDLHGMNRSEAQDAVESFIERMARLRPCCIKIIHGRGINSPSNSVLLKDNLPKLLASRKMSRYVVAYASSSQCDGGVGSMYVLVRPRPD